eukprot:4475029-Amphidinium_carterae.2
MASKRAGTKSRQSGWDLTFWVAVANAFRQGQGERRVLSEGDFLYRLGPRACRIAKGWRTKLKQERERQQYGLREKGGISPKQMEQTWPFPVSKDEGEWQSVPFGGHKGDDRMASKGGLASEHL